MDILVRLEDGTFCYKPIEETQLANNFRTHDDSKYFYHFTSLESFMKIWASGRLLLWERKYMNDNAEAEVVVSGVVNFADLQAYMYAIQEYKQLSLSVCTDDYCVYKSPVMWGVYANKSCGVCIELSKDKLSMEDCIGSNVVYKDTIPNAPELSYGTKIRSIAKAREFVDARINEIYFRKYIKWSFESEYRIISRIKDWIDISGAIENVYLFNMEIKDYEVLKSMNNKLVPENQLKFKSLYYRTSKNDTREVVCIEASEQYRLLSNPIQNNYIENENKRFRRMVENDKKKKQR